MVVQWPPKVWHGVVDPVNGDEIPPVRLGDAPRLTQEERKNMEQWVESMQDANDYELQTDAIDEYVKQQTQNGAEKSK